jgi:PHP family Zn ribbon phosphoesterase
MPDACHKCHRRFTEIDYYGKRLKDCIDCNGWKEVDRGVWRKIPEGDIEALKGMRRG